MADDPNQDDADVWERLARLPSLDDEPIEASWAERSSRAPRAQPRAPGERSAGGYAAAGQFHVPAPGSPSVAPSGPADRADMPPDVDLPAPEVAPGTHRPRRRWPRRVAVGVLVTLVLVTVGGFLLAWSTWRRVERVSIANLGTDTSQGTNYLIVGTDSRAGVDPDLETAGGIFGDGTEAFSGERTDTIVILRVAPDGNRFLALNRDLWLPIAGTGGEQRINTAFQGGPQQLVDTIQDSLGIPIHHYMEVDFAGFLGLVESIGGIDVEVANAAHDPKTGLDIPAAGLVHLDPQQALAFVRTRNYIETIDGRDVLDPTSDFGRVQRQQVFLEAVFNEVGSTKNPITLYRAANSLAGNVRIDDTWGFWEALRFGRRLKALDPESLKLPVFNFTGPNGEAVLGLEEAAETMLAQFR